MKFAHRKILPCAVFFCVAAAVSCSYFRKDQSNSSEISDDTKSEIPFVTAEPEKYQANFVVTFGNETTQYSTVRDGAARFTAFDGENALLETADGRRFQLDLSAKTAREIEKLAPQTPVEDAAETSFTRMILSPDAPAKFEKIFEDDATAKYKITREEDSSVSIVTFDKQKQLPTRQEFFDVETEPAVMTAEIKDFSTAPDAAKLSLPADFKIVKTP